MMSGEEVRLDQRFQPRGSLGDTLLEVQGLSGTGFEDVSFTLRRGEILGFAGLVGAGRSEVMQTIFGHLAASAGKVGMQGKPWQLGDPTASVRRGMLYLSEERKLHGILPRRSLRENIGISLFGQTAPHDLISRRREALLVAQVIERYGIRTSSPEQRIMFLSGGNQQKAIIGRAMAQAPRLLIFDEPTKGIDVRTKAEIYRLMQELAEAGIGIILVSSEMEELRRCASRIITMYAGRISGEFITDRTDNDALVRAIIGSGSGRHAA
jgi:ribose transport system ATP-binding protein